MIYCIFIADAADPRIKTCSRAGCTNRIVSDHPPEKCHALCEVGNGPCIHFGAETRRVECPTCRGNVQVKVFACAVFGECTLAKSLDGTACCQACEQFTPAKGPLSPRLVSLENVATRRNLIYHICPFDGADAWRHNIRQLVKRLDLFNGKRIVAIATGERLAPPVEVKAAFGEHAESIEFIELPNDVLLRERATFEPLMERVASTDPGEATFYAHAKGVSTVGSAEGVMYWRNLMYRTLLDEFESRVQPSLAEAPVVGTHRLAFHVTYPDGLAASDWHFSGSFFWFRNADVFSQDWRGELPASGWGVEAWPGRMFPLHESRCLAMENPVNAYDPGTYAESDRIADEGGPGEPVALKIEIGGGIYPKGEGYLNVDKLDVADVQVDFDAPEFRLPFDDDSVQAIYSSHCLEHIRDLRRLMRELVRVARIGCVFEIRVPHWGSSMAMCFDHKHTIAEPQIDHWCNTAVEFWFGGMTKKPRHMITDYKPSGHFEEAKALHPGWTDEQVFRFVPDTCHEIQYVLHVVPQ